MLQHNSLQSCLFSLTPQSNFYQRLGLTRGADSTAIQKAYDGIAKIIDPTRHTGQEQDRCEQANVLLGEAFSTLIDPQARRAYDEACYIEHRIFASMISGRSTHHKTSREKKSDDPWKGMTL
jgi:DnaJ-class molecular chaperone